MNNEVVSKIVWYCGQREHEHYSWESADECAQLFPLLEELKLETLRMAFSWLEFVRVMREEIPETRTELEESWRKLQRSLRIEYEAAGAPLGQGEAAMRQWFKNLNDRK
jgi:hypothetical protein